MNVEKEIKTLAKTLVDYCVKVKQGELVLVKFNGPGRQLVDELTKLISLKGAYSLTTLRNYNYYKYSPMKSLQKEFPLGKEISEKVNCVISIDDSEDLFKLKIVDNKRLNAASIANLENDRRIIEEKKWCIVRYPTSAFAQQAEMGLEEYQSYAFKTMNINWVKKKKESVKLKKLMDDTDIVRIVGDKMDLSFSIKGRKSIICAAEYNMPGGEVWTAPVKETVNGVMHCPVAYYNGKKFENITLHFRKGRITEFSVKNNKKEFEKIINADKHARFIGELGIGTNYNIKKVVGDILFDEKIGGTIHLALGSAYRENFREDFSKMSKKAGAELSNESAVHWDMIIRPKSLFFDGKRVKI
ncbi:MAG: aminopeptidase [Nanoarchaeota archaeon]|nr:aminopeptidase [Nanoarchaeota archaeon]